MKLTEKARKVRRKPTERYAVERIRTLVVLDGDGNEMARSTVSPRIVWDPSVAEVVLSWKIDDPGELA